MINVTQPYVPNFFLFILNIILQFYKFISAASFQSTLLKVKLYNYYFFVNVISGKISSSLYL